MKVYKRIWSFCLITAVSPFLAAGEVEIEKSLTKAIPSLKIESITKSEMQGVYRVETDASEVLFTDESGSFFLTGELYTTVGGQLNNLSEIRKKQLRADKISAVDAKEKIVFSPKGKTLAKIAVFTDIDCGYCRKLHKEVPRMNELGIEVSYLAYPRAGEGSESYNKFVSAWCADNKLDAMTLAKNGRAIPSKKCENPVLAQYKLGQALGVTGTPAIVLEDGTLVPGYLTADKLAKGLGLL
ncbi:MAG: thiol:disulfide interchange protein DsbC [Pseudohongiellaceae bacterium]|jgi:thiol:disulfide interchange protein DsbC